MTPAQLRKMVLKGYGPNDYKAQSSNADHWIPFYFDKLDHLHYTVGTDRLPHHIEVLISLNINRRYIKRDLTALIAPLHRLPVASGISIAHNIDRPGDIFSKVYPVTTLELMEKQINTDFRELMAAVYPLVPMK